MKGAETLNSNIVVQPLRKTVIYFSFESVPSVKDDIQD